VVGGEALVVAGAAAVAGDPGQGPFDHLPARQDLEGVGVIGRAWAAAVKQTIGLGEYPAILVPLVPSYRGR
jgi:hypothetical protein